MRPRPNPGKGEQRAVAWFGKTWKKNLEQAGHQQHIHALFMCFFCRVRAGARSRAHSATLPSTFFPRDHQAARLAATPEVLGRCTAKPFSDRLSSFSFAPQASHRAGPFSSAIIDQSLPWLRPLLLCHHACPFLSFTGRDGSLTRWPTPASDPKQQSKAGEASTSRLLAPIFGLAGFDACERIDSVLKTREERRPRPGEAPPRRGSPPPAGLACSASSLLEDEYRHPAVCSLFHHVVPSVH